MEHPDLVAVGLVGKPHGLRGEVYVRLDPDFADPLTPGRVVATDRHGDLTVTSTRDHSGRVVARFDGVATREAAEDLRGERLLLPRQEIELDEDAVWVDDLLGLEVVTEEGELVGVVEAVTDGPAHDYLLVARPDGGEALIPVVDELVELDGERIVVRPVPGLLDQ
ncbi:MAG TPA: ribosome maturation factor RimM [Egibacteraceae bacterium]|nr:ribosome maturation factor RimM [Egibacteraceae bacterium]